MVIRSIFAMLLIHILIISGFSDLRLKTPLEKSNYTGLSSHADMMVYLDSLVGKSELVRMEIIGRSVENREIPALFFSSDTQFAVNRQSKPIVFIFCQQHGDEPSGKEAALVLARALLNEQHEILEKLDLILVPQVNPDGSEKEQRHNANDMDLNRNHVILSEPESQAIHNLFLRWMPEVTLDVHEYTAISEKWISNGFIKDADEQLGGLTNLNIAPETIQFTRNVMIPEVGQLIQSQGFTFHRYIVGSPFEGSRMRYSTTAINDGRQSLGIYNTLSFILEGKKYADQITGIRRRTEGQVVALLSFLRVAGSHADEIKRLVSAARTTLISNSMSRRAIVQMDHYADSTQPTLKFPVFDLQKWNHEERELGNFHPLVKARKTVSLPFAYIVPPTEMRLIQLLHKHKIKMQKFKSSRELEVEVYRILHVTSRTEEELTFPYLDIEKAQRQQTIEDGSYLIPIAQPASLLLPLVLEPESSFGIVTESSGRKDRFVEYLQEGRDYPIYRLMEEIELE